MNNILSIVDNINGNSVNAGQVALLCIIGFAIVMLVLVVLIALLMLFAKVFGKLDALTFGKKSVPAEVSATQAHAVTDESEETVVAITAALLAFYDAGKVESGEDVPPPFIIRSIKKN